MDLDYAMNTSYQLGTYKAIAEMMKEAIRDMSSDDEFTASFAQRRLENLAEQYDDAVKKFETVY